MKILRITVNNIASLAGTHSVDFSRDPLRTAGLFAISGATGAGKSTLLDALCLALFDATPRLQQVGRLAELTDGERQNDPRMLLRRGAGQGYAEVAFVGVDRKPWTARWSVRRSRGNADGALQHVDMTLFEGHISPGGTGKVANGGKKTLVKEAIVEKVGLRFDQFTRAVLLAQNDFATFLKSNDKERAEILQALTGTERFEAVSQAVFERCHLEREKVKAIEAKQGSNQPLDDAARTDAEAAATTAEKHAVLVEQQVRRQESCAEWFRHMAQLQGEQEKSRAALQAAVALRDAAKDRRTELEHTEAVTAEARKLRDIDVQAVREAESTAKLAVDAEQKLVTQQLVVRAAATALEESQQQQEKSRQEFEAAQPLLKRARELDGRLDAARENAVKAQDALSTACTAAQTATKKRDDAVSKRNKLQQNQQALEKQREELAAFVPFVAESSMWMHRLNTAIDAEQQACTARETLRILNTELQEQQRQRQIQRKTEAALKQQADASMRQLREAEEQENEIDAEQLEADRQEAENAHRALAALTQQLREIQRTRDEHDSAVRELDDLLEQQTTDEAALKQVRDVLLPGTLRDLRVARDQLELIEAAVDDHASRLRLSLQDNHPCPVCGSHDHPYRDHEPDIESTAVRAGRQNVKTHEHHRETAMAEQQRLEISIQGRAKQINQVRRRRESLHALLEQTDFECSDHPMAKEVMALPEDARRRGCENRLTVIAALLEQVQVSQKAHRNAMTRTQSTRQLAEHARQEWESLQRGLMDLEQQFRVTETKHAAAETACQRADERHHDAMNALGGLWSGVPNARDRFNSHADEFRGEFQASIDTCGQIEQQLGAVMSQIQAASASIEPLADAARLAEATLADRETANADAVAARDLIHQQRQTLFQGRSADTVEEELLASQQTADGRLDGARNEKHTAVTSLATAEVTRNSAQDASERAILQRRKAQANMAEWLTSFAARTSREMTVGQLDVILARDRTWISAERQHLTDLDTAVTSAATECRVYEQQLQAHLVQRPTTEEESAVLAALDKLRDELKLARTAHEEARDVIRNDDRLRRQNAELTRELAKQEAVADPWLKLNELIGSADGAKFRMIAQRRTLDALLSDANQQLNQLSARYRLERLPESLNLVVIDCDMGDERRSIHSLSGGESFLVSLALALGLASLASNRLQIESLFIDEGFGSLDPETLNTAMNALMHLEAQGRKVGVISHVTEMTDAIPVRVQVVKRRGGASQVVVPGAEPISAAQAPLDQPAAPPASCDVPIDLIAIRVLEILNRESLAGKDKVSTAALRKEIGCALQDIKAAQSQLGEQVIPDGRSLRLAEDRV